MNKSRRINELARDLEVKSHEILDKLKELGISGKTHSSSVDEDVAIRLRDLLAPSRGLSVRQDQPGEETNGHHGAAKPEAKEVSSPPRRSRPEKVLAEQAAPAPAEAGSEPRAAASETASGATASPAAADSVKTAEPAAGSEEPEKPAARSGLRPPLSAGPFRPPLAGGPRPTPAYAPPAPRPPGVVLAHPPASAPLNKLATAPLKAPTEVSEKSFDNAEGPATETAAVPGTQPATAKKPVAPLASPVTPSVPPARSAGTPPASPPTAPASAGGGIPGRPVPAPVRPIPSAARPGQVLSGPRQPLPGGVTAGVGPGSPLISRPGMVRPAPSAGTQAGPAIPSQPITPRPSPGGPIARPAPSTAAPARPPTSQIAPGSIRPLAAAGSRPGLVGQPTLRPIVPPRPDLAAKLQPRANPAFAAPPPPPRPGAPIRPPSSPAPGRPIYQGPARPGQGPMQARGPSRPGGTSAPGARPGMRPGMHPTSRPGGLVGPGPMPPTGGDQNRSRPGQYRPGGRPQGRRRDAGDDAEKHLRPVRREAPAGPPPISRDITISEGVTVKELSEKLEIKANLVIKKLVDRGIFATINQTLDSKMATELAREFGASTSTISFEAEAMADVEIMEAPGDLITRAPVVTIMGHVDHGKTSLLDAIREANVAARESGGITQHIGAYHVEKNGRKIVFIDTPGHEAFTRMRSRGAKVTDIVVLVVAADDGVMPQTLEAIDHARAAKVPIIVAINKIDRAEAQVDRIKQQLSDRGLLAEDWGGDVVMVPVSARTKQNLGTLLEMILLVADILDLKANPNRPAMGSVLESKLDRGRGPVATVLVRNGTLRVGDFFICGDVFGKVRALIDDGGNQVREVEPSMPVEVLGLDAMPTAGDEFQVVTDTAKAKQIVMYREAKARDTALTKNKRMTLEQLQKQMAQGEVKDLNLILKADVGGSAEVLSDTLQALSTDKVRVRVLRSGVGTITESDVLLAAASEAIVIGFNVKPDRAAAAAAEHEGVDVRLHSIIYNLTDEIKKSMTGLLAPVYRELYRGKAEVRQLFKVSKVGSVCGCLVTDGIFNRDCLIRVTRDGVVVANTKVSSLKRFKDDVSEVRSGMECGITLNDSSEVKEGDLLEGYLTERVATEL